MQPVQTGVPPSGSQAGPPPHAQSPFAQRSEVPGSQAPQPNAPLQRGKLFAQTEPPQQPHGQLTVGPERLQVQVSLPGSHAALKPQLTHARPPTPHASWPGLGTQVLPLQQPLGQLAALHRQASPAHCWPGLQAGLAPQVHCPEVEHALAVKAQLWHCAPLSPQLPTDEAVHAPVAPPWQQPASQLAALH